MSVFGVDHTLVGRRVAHQWRWPRAIEEAIWLHHHDLDLLPADLAARELVMIVQAADGLARREEIGWSGNRADTVELSRLAHALGISLNGMEAIATKLRNDADALAARVKASKSQRAGGEEGDALRLAGEFARATLELRELPKVCQLAADAACHGLRAQGAVLFVVQSPPAPAVMAWTNRSASGVEAIEFDDLGCDLAALRREMGRLRDATSIAVPVSGALAAMGERFVGRIGGRPGRLVSLDCGDACVGGVLVRMADPASCEDIALGSQMAALRAVIGLAISRTADVADATRLAEGLSTAARAAGAARDATDELRELRLVDDLASGAAHELNTPLAVIDGRLQQLLLRETDHDTRVTLEQIRAEAGRCAEVVSGLASVADPRPPKCEAVDAAVLIRAAVASYTATGKLGESQVRLELSDGLRPIWADAGQAREILDELLANAIAATEPARRLLTIKAAFDRADEHIVITLSDNGCGMTPEVLERAFDPFFSHRPAGRGRGLGLPRARRLATLNGGSVRLWSAADRGTRVVLRLPTRR